MQFRRSGLRDERRRRALMEDLAGDSAPAHHDDVAEVGARASSRTYSKTAVDERRVRVIDVVPLYPMHVASVYVVLGLGIAALLALHHYASHLLRWADLSRVDSLGTWLTSGLLLLGALGGVLIFRIRRHRLDDYRGRYRCWVGIALLLGIASLDTALGFRRDVGLGLEALSHMELLGHADGWWALLWALAAGAMGLRALLEVRESRGTLVVAVLSGTLMAVWLGLQLDLLPLPQEVPPALALYGAHLGGVGLLLAAVVQYARFVWLDAQGLVVRQTAGSQEAEPADNAAAKRSATRRRSTKEKPTQSPPAAGPEEEQTGAKPRWKWLSWARKAQPQGEVSEGEETTSTKAKPAKAKPAAAAKSTVQRSQATETDDAAAAEKPRRKWFSWGGKSDVAADEAEAPAKKPRPKLAQAAPTGEQPADEPRRSWFSRLGKLGAVSQADGTEKPAAPKEKGKRAAAADGDQAAEKPRRSWFAWGRSSDGQEAQPENGANDEQRKTMTPKITTRPKAARVETPEEKPAPRPVTPPTITGNFTPSAADEDDAQENEEILRLESKPEHELSKAERRRLKKLKRRSAA